VGFYTTTDHRAPSEMLAFLKDCDERNFVMTAGIDTGAKDSERQDGLISQHAYSLIHVFHTAADVTLLCLRNPWGNDKEWNGDWSDKSDLWEKHPAVAAELGFTPAADGLFWMCYDDFCKSFTTVSICCKSMRAHGKIARKTSHKKMPHPQQPPEMLLHHRSTASALSDDDDDDELVATEIFLTDTVPSPTRPRTVDAKLILTVGTCLALGFAAGAFSRLDVDGACQPPPRSRVGAACADRHAPAPWPRRLGARWRAALEARRWPRLLEIA